MSTTTEGKPPGAMPSKSGMMSVMSKVLHPTALDPPDFCQWYENTHIQEVQATGGIAATQRYESLSFMNIYRQPDTAAVENKNCGYDFITVYQMPDLSFRDSAAFKVLAGQSKPNDETQLLEKLFKHSEFCTRFCEELGEDKQSASAAHPAPYLITIGVQSTMSPASVLSELSSAAGSAKMKAYKVHEASTLSEFRRAYSKEPDEMILLEFNVRPDFPELLKASQDHEGLEIGFWGLRRAYDGTERTPAPWKPK